MDDVLQAAQSGLRKRDFENGKKMYAAARCMVCHRFGGDGGATGPDLTQLAGRFNLKDLTESIVDPSKVIAEQYKASIVVTAQRQVVHRPNRRRQQQQSRHRHRSGRFHENRSTGER